MTVVRTIPRPDPALVAALGSRSTPILHEALGKRGALASAIKPLARGHRLAGPAFTVSSPATDNLMTHLALSLAEPGDVLVVDAKAMTETGSWGDLMTFAAKTRGLAGLVIDGSVRDTDQILELGFPVFCRGISIKGTTKAHADGSVNLPVSCGDVVVAPGDIVVGDSDGVVAIPADEAAALLDKVKTREAWEEDLRRKLGAGVTTIDALGLAPALRAGGISW